MAFSASTLLPMSSMANSDAPRHWTYTTADAKATVVASGYFNNAANLLNVRDIIWCINSNGGTETLEAVMVDAISTAGVVTTLSSTLTLA